MFRMFCVFVLPGVCRFSTFSHVHRVHDLYFCSFCVLVQRFSEDAFFFFLQSKAHERLRPVQRTRDKKQTVQLKRH